MSSEESPSLPNLEEERIEAHSSWDRVLGFMNSGLRSRVIAFVQMEKTILWNEFVLFDVV